MMIWKACNAPALSWRTARPVPALLLFLFRELRWQLSGAVQRRPRRQAAFTRPSVVRGQSTAGHSVKHFAYSMIFARLVEKKIRAERQALGTVLGERIVGENDHL